MKKKALVITTIAGFLPQFEMHHIEVLKDLGFSIFYASNFENPVYRFDKAELENKGIKLIPIPISKFPKDIKVNIETINMLAKIIDEEKIDLVHCNNPMGGVVGRLAAKKSKTKAFVAYTAHGFHFYKGAPLKNRIIYYMVERYLAKYTDCLITINEEDYEASKKLPLKNNAFIKKICGVGVDMEKFQPRKNEYLTMRKELGVPEDAFHIITAAELNENKNQKTVIDAIAQIDDKKIYYSLCGQGEMKDALESHINRHGLSDRVKLLGYRYDMEKVLQSADCFAFPSIREGLGVAAVEALACGVPLIAADNRGTREYAKNGYNSIVVPAQDVDAYKNALIKFSTNDKFRLDCAKNSRESVKAFSKENIKDVMKEIYIIINNEIEKSGGGKRQNINCQTRSD